MRTRKVKTAIMIPKGLNTKEAPMYRSLMLSKDHNLTKKWHYGLRQFLIGRKTTNHKTGVVKVEFSTEPRLLKSLEPPLKNRDEKCYLCLEGFEKGVGKFSVFMDKKMRRVHKKCYGRHKTEAKKTNILVKVK